MSKKHHHRRNHNHLHRHHHSNIPSSKYHSCEGFEIVAKDLWKGKHGRISLVKKSNGEKLVWKRPRSLDWTHINSFREEIQKAKIWRKIGISDINIYWHKDRMSVIKDYIDGPTLKEMLKNDPYFFSSKNGPSKPLKELGKFVTKLVKSDRLICDINRLNIIWDKEKDKFQLIDSSTVYSKGQFPNIAEKYEMHFLKSWSKSLPLHEIKYLKSFLKEYCIKS